MTTSPDTPDDPTDQTTYTQQRLPGVDWDKINYVVKTPAEIDASLFGDEYAEALSDALLSAYGVTVTPQQLKICDALAQRDIAANLLRALQAEANA